MTPVWPLVGLIVLSGSIAAGLVVVVVRDALRSRGHARSNELWSGSTVGQTADDPPEAPTFARDPAEEWVHDGRFNASVGIAIPQCCGCVHNSLSVVREFAATVRVSVETCVAPSGLLVYRPCVCCSVGTAFVARWSSDEFARGGH